MSSNCQCPQRFFRFLIITSYDDERLKLCCILLIRCLVGAWNCPCLQPVWSQWWQPPGLSCWKRPQAERIQVGSHIIPGSRPQCFGPWNVHMCINEPKIVGLKRDWDQIQNKYFLPGVHLTLTTEHGVMGKSKRSTSFQTRRPPGCYYWGPQHIIWGGVQQTQTLKMNNQ